MKIKILLLCLFSVLTATQAQSPSLTGKVLDKTSNQPISYVTIVVKKDGAIASGGITDDNGLFEVKKLEAKSYQVEISFMGYKTYTTTADFSTGQSSISLGTILLEDETTQLQDVTIIAERSTIEQKIDRKVINVGRDLTTAGATASDIMSNVPSVNVDQDGRISLRGNENVRILVDGRPTNIDAAQLLKQIPSTSIKRIELITNPSAKYNPEGMSGIINIVLHKNSNDGFNASINTGVTFAESPKINNSVNMNYRRGKVNFFGTYGNNFGDQYNDGSISRLDDKPNQQTLNIVNDNNSHLFKVGMDYYIDDRNTISIYTNQNFYSGVGLINVDLRDPRPGESLFQRSKYVTDNTNGAYNLAYKHLFKKEGQTLDVELNYSDYVEEQKAFFDTAFDDATMPGRAYRDDILDARQNTTVNLDYVSPVGKTGNLELGAEARLVRTQTDYFNTGASFEDAIYDYDLDIYSAYATFGQRFDKFSYQLGARFESYKVNAVLNGAEVYSDDYVTLYPSASLTYSPREKDMFQLSYSRRVDRPSLEQTKPVREFATPKMISFGNPELDPQFTNSVEVNYTRSLEKGSISGGLFLRSINDEINRYIYPDPENPDSQIMTYDNFDNNTAFGFELSANYKITKWWDVQPAIDYSNISQRGVVSVEDTNTGNYTFIEREADVAAFNARLNSNFKATKSLRFLVFGFFRSGVEGIQFHTNDMYKIDIGARYSFLKDKASLSLRFNDVFDTMEFSYDTPYPYAQKARFGWESQSVFINFNYSFGAGKNSALQRKQRDDNTKQGGGGMF
ncbi:MAG: TonB-dependent receptor [Flavobacterium sp.]|nr:TonB-dependent receptor [Flavobacterium sp.]